MSWQHCTEPVPARPLVSPRKAASARDAHALHAGPTQFCLGSSVNAVCFPSKQQAGLALHTHFAAELSRSSVASSSAPPTLAHARPIRATAADATPREGSCAARRCSWQAPPRALRAHSRSDIPQQGPRSAQLAHDVTSSTVAARLHGKPDIDRLAGHHTCLVVHETGHKAHMYLSEGDQGLPQPKRLAWGPVRLPGAHHIALVARGRRRPRRGNARVRARRPALAGGPLARRSVRVKHQQRLYHKQLGEQAAGRCRARQQLHVCRGHPLTAHRHGQGHQDGRRPDELRRHHGSA